MQRQAVVKATSCARVLRRSSDPRATLSNGNALCNRCKNMPSWSGVRRGWHRKHSTCVLHHRVAVRAAKHTIQLSSTRQC